MTGWVLLGAMAALPLIGIPLQRFPVFRAIHPAARRGLSAGLGAVAICTEMLVFTWIGWRWTVGLLLLPVAAVAIARWRFRGSAARAPSEEFPRLAFCATLLILATLTYAVGTARATAADFVLFWGAKGERFGSVGAIDFAYLRDPLHFSMHADYPPMLPCLYAWATMVAGRFAWGAALLTSPFFLALTAAAFFGFAQPVLGRRLAAESACLLTAILGLVTVANLIAGDAEPLLLYFEVLALSALVFAGRRPEGLASAAVGLTGAVLTKVEGTVFAGLVVVLYVGLLAGGHRRRAAAILALPPAVALALWLAFCRQHGLLDIYRLAARTKLSWVYLPVVIREIVRQASYGLAFAPWIVVGVLALGRVPSRTAVMALCVAAGFLGFMVYMYLTQPSDPSLWVYWSAARLLLTPLICCFFVAVDRANS